MADPRPYLPIGETLTPDLAAAIVGTYRGETEEHLAILLGYLDGCRAAVVASGTYGADELVLMRGAFPRSVDDPALELAWAETTDRWGKRLALDVRLWWEPGFVAADESDELLGPLPRGHGSATMSADQEPTVSRSLAPTSRRPPCDQEPTGRARA